MTPDEYWRDFAAWAAGPVIAPEPILDRAQDAFIDTIASILGAHDEPAAKAAAAIAAPTRAGRAMALAVAGHALDFDDYDPPSIGHPSTVLVPVVLSFPELSGADAIEVYLVGLEAMDRLGEVVNPGHYEIGWQATATLGTFGAAASAGRALGLDANQMLTALSIAAGTASGIKAQFGSGAKPMNVGFAAQTGLQAAQLAAAGMDARAETIWGPQGFAALTGGSGTAVKSPSGPPGEPFLIETFGLIAKPWPCCGYLSRIVDVLVKLSSDLEPKMIQAITLRSPPRNAAILIYDTPETPDQARFSPSYCAAVALMFGTVTPGDFSNSAIHRPEVIALAAKVDFASTGKAQSDVDLDPADPDEITIRLTTGETINRRAVRMRGGPDAPMDRADFVAKLHSCAPEKVDADALIAALLDLLTAPDLTQITRHIPQISP